MHVVPKKTWIIQKYIEAPLLIMNRKLDMRVWVVVPCWNPLQIYMYKECYIRFSCNDYDARNYKNLFSHLTNNSVAKKCIERPDNRRMLNKIPGNMWTLAEFREYLNKVPAQPSVAALDVKEEDEMSANGMEESEANFDDAGDSEDNDD